MADEKLENKRAALYIRVSSEEQAMKGYSLEAQLADLQAFAKENYMIVVDTYVDAGATARKKIHNRKGFQRMLSDVKADKIDVILFIRLDRWFRNIADYYDVQKVLDAHNVVWKCTQEFYDTTTANGRLNLNIKLAIAQDEADRTGDRIRSIQKNKVKNGEVISGSVPYGFYIDRTDKRHKILAVDDEKMKVTLDAFDYFLSCQSRRKTRLYIGDKYGIHWTDQTFQGMIYNDLYAGEYRGNKSYCPAAVDKSKLIEMRRICEKLHQHSRSGVHCYIFGGLARCNICKNVMHGVADQKKDGSYTFYYRCSSHYNRHACVNNRSVREVVIEEHMLKNIDRYLKQYVMECEVTEAQNTKPRAEKAKLKAKLRKLKDLYLEDMIDKQDYKKDYDYYMKELERIEETPIPGGNIEKVKELLDQGFMNIYNGLEREEKRTLWRSIIKAIYITEDREVLPPIFL